MFDFFLNESGSFLALWILFALCVLIQPASKKMLEAPILYRLLSFLVAPDTERRKSYPAFTDNA